MSRPLLTSLFFLLMVPLQAAPFISEFLASNANGLQDQDGDHADWIEIHNPTGITLDLTGWHLSDDPRDPTRWTFPATDLLPDEHLIVFASGKDRAFAGAELHTNFKLSKDGEFLALIAPDLVPVSEFNFPAQVTGISYGLTASGDTLTLLSQGAPVRALVPGARDDELIGSSWRGADRAFDDSAWQNGPLGVGFERSSGFEDEIGLDLEAEAWGVNSSVYLRIPLSEGIDPGNLASLTLGMKYDDGFSAFLNGTPVARANAPASLTWNSNATTGVSDSRALQFQEFDLTPAIASLRPTDNLLAIHGLNQFSASGDFLIRPELVATLLNPFPAVAGFFSLPTPGEANPATNTPVPVSPHAGSVAISEASGVKNAEVTVNLTGELPGAAIHYTLDGSDPTPADPRYDNPLTFSSPTRLRARAFFPDKLPGPLALADYSFLAPSLRDYLSEVPVIVIDNFGAGPYPNKGRSNDGRDVVQIPRQANVMSIFTPSGDNQPFLNPPMLQSRTGCRVRGSSSSTFPRKSLSVEFRDEQNEDHDLTPFGFPPEADWVLNAPNPVFDRSLLHNTVAFGIADMMGAHAPGNQMVVVFQNTDGGRVTASDLAGVYLFSEKIERNRMGVDFPKLNGDGSEGGWMLKIDRMEAIPEGLPVTTLQPNFHAPGPNGILEIPDDQQNSGGTQSVDDLSEFYHSYLNFDSPGSYEILPNQRARIQESTRAMDAAVWAGRFHEHLDLESWARNFAVHNLAKNQDAHVLSTFLYQENPDALIKMGPVWDFDRAFTWKGGARDTPFWAADRDWYPGLFQDADFRQTLQDLWQETRRERARNARLRDLVEQSAAGLRPDQVAASGLAYATWQNRVIEMTGWLTDRANFLDQRYEPLPTVSPESGLFVEAFSVSLSPSDGGTVYYTTGGRDLRASGGGLAASARAAPPLLEVTSRTTLIARTREGNRWSGPVSRVYDREGSLPRLVISEISYHPAEPTASEIARGFSEAKDFEFLELTNFGTTPLALFPFRLHGGVGFRFGDSAITTLPPGGRVLLVRNAAAFEARYGSGLPVAGAFSGTLNNAGENLILEDAELSLVLQDFSYSDDSPWPACADGPGYSLVLKEPFESADPSQPARWRCSSLPGGNPGTSDARPLIVAEPLADQDRDGFDALLEHFLGTSDLIPGDASGLIVEGTVVAPDSLSYPTLSVTYRVGADRLEFLPQWSADLRQWIDGSGVLVKIREIQNGAGTATVVWRTTAPLASSPQFLRLTVFSK